MVRVRYLASSAIALVLCAALAHAQSSTEEYTYDPLGRLIKTETTGGQNNGEVHGICYDDAGNRVEYSLKAGGIAAACVTAGASQGPQSTPTPAPSPSPSPSPSPTPTPTNSPPTANADLTSGACSTMKTVNVTSNDQDDGGVSNLTLTALSGGTGGSASASIVSASSISVLFGPAGDFTTFTYTIADQQGLTATGELNASTSSCSGGPPPE